MMRLNYEQAREYLLELSADSSHSIEINGRSLKFRDSIFRLPMLFPAIPAEYTIQGYSNSVPETPLPYVIILIRAGTASLGFYLDGELEAHKVVRKYMVRKSQGRMQIAYLNKKGKSRAGSRIRLRESVEFFEEINQKLADWFDEFGEPALIFQSCPVRLWSHWFESKVEAPFHSRDTRLIRVPFHVHQPDHDEMLRINRLISTGTVDEPPEEESSGDESTEDSMRNADEEFD